MSEANDLIKSDNDKKQYQYHVLPNGLKVLLIHDPDVADSLHHQSQDGTSNHSDAEHDDGSDTPGTEADSSGSADSDGSEGEGSEDQSEVEDGDTEQEGAPTRAGTKKHVAVKKAAAAMAVGVGSFSDPEHLQGLSHYLEHMLFMGSEKFPNENEYDEYLTKHGGSCNAFTDMETTNFYFDVHPSALQGALDRFAQFFVSPLCLEGSLEREVLAVDSEFSGVLQSDQCRLTQLMCHTSSPGHLYQKFSWGNRKSLWDLPREGGVDVRAALLQYYRQQYSAERMALVVLGGQPLEELRSWAEQLFVAVPSGLGPRPDFAGTPPPFEGRQLHMLPAVKDHHEVSITFQMPCLHAHYPAKADQYISHLIGHEGPGSLLSALKSRGWATEVVAGIEEDGYDMNSFTYLFGVSITLTEAGLHAGPGYGLAAVALLFQYINMIREAGPQEWVWREMAAIADMKFRFHEEDDASDTVSRLAGLMHIREPQHLLVADFLHRDWRPDLVSQLLARLHPASASYRVDLLTKQHAQLKEGLAQLLPGSTHIREPWFDMEAVSAQLPQDMCSTWATQQAAQDLRLPPPNPYVATDFSLRELQQAPAQHSSCSSLLGITPVLPGPPAMVLDVPGLWLWYKADDVFKMPRTNAYFRLWSPALHDSPRAAALSHLALKLLEDVLAEDGYLADVAGLHYSTSPEGQAGLELRVDGFSHKHAAFVQRLFDVLVALPGSSSFAVVKEALVRRYSNSNMQVPKHANYLRLYALCSRVWHHDKVLPELEALTPDDVAAFLPQLLRSCHLECMLHGNLTLQEATELAKALQQRLGPGCNLAADQRVRDACIKLEPGTAVLHCATAKNQDETNAAVEIYYQVGPSSDVRQRALLDLADQLIYEPCYDTLRTKEQLGYTVSSGSRLTHAVLGFCVVVVSAKYSAEHLDQRVDEFLASYQQRLADLAEEEFERHKAALVASKLTRDRHLVDESERHWGHISTGRLDFLSREEEVAALEKLTLPDVLEWYRSHLGDASSSGWRKLSIHVSPPQSGHGSGKASPAGQAACGSPSTKRAKLLDGTRCRAIQDVDAFKNSADVWAVPTA